MGYIHHRSLTTKGGEITCGIHCNLALFTGLMAALGLLVTYSEMIWYMSQRHVPNFFTGQSDTFSHCSKQLEGVGGY